MRPIIIFEIFRPLSELLSNRTGFFNSRTRGQSVEPALEIGKISNLLALALVQAPSVAGQSAPLRLAQASAPADRNIKAVRSDLDRHEKTAKGLRPGASGAKRTLKLLGLSEKRLQSSANKSHPSWLDTNARLQALKHRLTELAAGRNPDAAPAAASPPAAPAASASQPASGAVPADPKLAKAVADLGQVEADFAQMAPGDKNRGRQLIAALNKIATALKAYPNRKDPDWVKAAGRAPGPGCHNLHRAL